MAWGISPKQSTIVPLGDFGTEKYLAIVFKAFENLNWKVSYADEQGLIAYTPISFQSYSEQITVIVKDETAHLKSECVGFQGFLNDYGKNKKNLELLINEIEYAAFHFKVDEIGNIQYFKAHFYQHPGIDLENTPLGAKAQLTHLGSIFVPKKNYQVVPWLIIINCAVFLLQRITIMAYGFVLSMKFSQSQHSENLMDTINSFNNLIYGGIERNLVLDGSYWRLVAACFSHINLIHLFSNMIALAYIGSILEARVGKWNFLALYIITGICASLASIGYRYEGLGVGASGAIMGLFGVLLAYLSTSFFDKKARVAFLIGTSIIVAISTIPHNAEIDYAAHIGGLISGYILGWFSYWAYTKPEVAKRNLIRAVSYSLVLCIAISSLAFIPRYDIPKYEHEKQSMIDDLNQLSDYFYAEEYRGISRAEKIELLEKKALPLIKKDRSFLKKLAAYPLPQDQQKDAKIYDVFFEKKLMIYELLYKEYKTGDSKYRNQINQLYDEIRKLQN